MTDRVVRYEVAGGFATVTLDSPHNRNALTPALMAGLAQGFDHLVGGFRVDKPPGRAAEAQGGERREGDGQIR